MFFYCVGIYIGSVEDYGKKNCLMILNVFEGFFGKWRRLNNNFFVV